MTMEIDKCMRSDNRNAQTSEENFEIYNLSPIEEVSESPLRSKEASTNFVVSESEGSDNNSMIKPPCEAYKRILGKIEGNSSSGDERTEQDYQLRRVEDSYSCFTSASGDNDEAETGLRDKSLKTTVEQLKRRLSQAEREIVALRTHRSPQECWNHERCEILQRDLLTWRNDHEKRINSQIVRWQLAERKLYDEMENTRRRYNNIQRHLQSLERQSARFYYDFRRQIDVWEKRLKDNVVDLHESNLMELRDQFKAWFEMQNAINSSNARKEKCEVHRVRNDTVEENQDESCKLINLEMTTLRENAKFVHKIEHFIKFEIQQHRNDLVKRMDQKIAELWSALENFKHNFHLDRDYRLRNYIGINNDETESVITELLSDLTCRETTKSEWNTDSEETSQN
ncbi:uncharacterized protein [Linepithema humile]|uniref:uncharacterized protein n=1 Tax=Linepithema humile TaxID=83485 RepID=UPI00351F42C8